MHEVVIIAFDTLFSSKVLVKRILPVEICFYEKAYLKKDVKINLIFNLPPI